MPHRKDLARVRPLYLKDEYESMTGTTVPRATWYDWLKKAAVKNVIPRKGPSVKPCHYAPRSQWADDALVMLHRREIDLKDIIFVDATQLALGVPYPFQQSMAKVCQRRAAQMRTQATQKTKAIEYYAGMMLGYKTELMPLNIERPDKMTKPGAREFKNFIEDYLKPMLTQVRHDRGLGTKPHTFYVVMDCAAAHKAEATRTELAKIGVQSLGLSSHSPEVNVIEPAWKLFKDAVAKHPGRLRNIAALTRAAVKAWREDVKQEALDGLIRSFPKCCSLMVEAKGYPFSRKSLK